MDASPAAPALAVAPALPETLVALHRCLAELAAVSDQIVASTEVRDGGTLVDDLFARSAALRTKLAEAAERGKNVAPPTGPRGAAFVAELRSLNQRIRAGSAAAERIVASRETVRQFGERFVLQALANLHATAAWPSVARLKDAFRGVPAIIVSAGPSLEKNIQVLKQFEGKALIIVVSHALRAVARAGVHADVCIAVDAQDLRYHFAAGACESVGTLVLGTSAHPELFKLPVPRIFTVAGNAALDGWVHRGFEEEFVCRSGGSVANHAFSLATLWGCDPIVLVGQDLSFPGGKAYAASTVDGDARIEVAASGAVATMTDTSKEMHALDGGSPILLRDVPGYDGGTVPTSFAFQKAWEWFGAAARELAGARALVNSTEGGARIEGMEQIPLADAARRYANAPVDAAGIFAAVVADIDRDRRRERMGVRIAGMISALERCGTAADECLQLAPMAARRREALRGLAAKEKELTRAVDAVDFVSTMVQTEIHSAMSAGKGATTVEEGVAASTQMYRAIQRIVAVAIPELEKARAELGA